MEDKNLPKKIAIAALVFALISIGISQSITSTGNTTVGLQIVVNNTNLAPFVAGHGGIGERVGNNTTYWNNNTPIEIFLYSHANTSGTAAEIHLFINGTKVSDTSGRALGIAEQSNRSIIAIIPQYSFYSVDMVNYHHYEWYEYQILTGNVTTNGTSGTMDHALLSNLNWGASGHTIDGDFNLNGNALTNVTVITDSSAGGYVAFASNVDMDGGNIINVNTLNVTTINSATINEKINKTDDILYNYTTWIWKNGQAITMDMGGTPLSTRNLTTTTDIYSAQGATTVGLRHSLYPTYQIRSGGGPSVLYSIQGGDGNMKFTGRTNILWDNVTTNTTEFTVFLKRDSTDTFANTNRVLSCYSNQSCVFWGNVNVTNMAGTGNAYVCVNASGVLYRGSPTC